MNAAHNSSPLGIICLGGSLNPYLPVSLSSDVYTNLAPTTPLYQSSDAPAAGSVKVASYYGTLDFTVGHTCWLYWHVYLQEV